MGQLLKLIRARTSSRPSRLNKIKGQPFKITEVGAAIDAILEERGNKYMTDRHTLCR